MRCGACGRESPDGKRFCADCGAPLAASCSSCGAELVAGKRFCGDCGAPVDVPTGAGSPVQAAPPPTAAATALDGSPSPPTAAGTTELRYVSVLFCDLVGFTPFSERRDPEEVREVLSGYFELARSIIGRYGGVVQKFIGDAVMAVWGAPVAQEDDAERAVRAALDLASAVAAYGSEHGTELQARVGIVTGEAATTETAEEGLVIGDRVNTAARIQSAAPPGACYVDETTRAATSAAIAYADAGEHDLKGKSAPVRLFQANRVVAAVAGSQRSGVIEAPFVGRDRELRLVKELFHGTAERTSARMVLVSGVAGVGKSRLAWEFFKYIDGLAGEVLWHSGRCLSYGEGVSYWALSEMIRARLQIGEDDPQDLVAERLRAGLERWIPDPADREYIRPRLGQLLGMSSTQTLAREELFSGWRLFFERLAEHLPVVLVVEDLQWADAGLVDFLDHLLEWSGDHAIFLLVLTRPEGTDRRGLGLSRRSVTTLPLDPLESDVMGGLLDGLVPGLPPTARARIVEYAEGIPLYAVETVRSLLDKGVLEKGDDGALRLVGEVGALEIPPGLTALIASRLDALDPDERRLVKECSVLGGSFPRSAVGALSELDPALLDDLLSSLVRKEVLTVRADKLSPERGQYAFTQSLIRSVAYDMLTRSERKARHLRTAEHLRTAFPDGGAEVAEVIGAHLYDAYRAAGDDPDAEALRAEACRAYVLAGERAESVGAPEAAEAAFLRAAELTSDELESAELTYRAAEAAFLAGWSERAAEHCERAKADHEGAGRLVEAARVTSLLSASLASSGRAEQAIALLRRTLESLEESDAPAELIAELYSRLGGPLLFSGHGDEAAGAIDTALTLAQHYELTQPFSRALVSKATLYFTAGRYEEARLNYEGVIALARRGGLTRSELIAEGNLGDLCMAADLPGSEEHSRAALATARRWGLRGEEGWAAANLMYTLTIGGRLEEARRIGNETLQSGDERPGAKEIHGRLAWVDAQAGDLEAARRHLEVIAEWVTNEDAQYRGMYLATRAAIRLAEGEYAEALESASQVVDQGLAGGFGVAHEMFRQAFPIALEAAAGLGDLDELDRLVELLASRPRGVVPPFLRAQLRRARALLGAARDAERSTVESDFLAAEATMDELGYPYWTARVQLERAEWLARHNGGHGAAAVADEAFVTFRSIGAAPMASRALRLSQPEPSGVAGSVASG